MKLKSTEYWTRLVDVVHSMQFISTPLMVLSVP